MREQAEERQHVMRQMLARQPMNNREKHSPERDGAEVSVEEMRALLRGTSRTPLGADQAMWGVPGALFGN